MKKPGRLVPGHDDAGQCFVLAICPTCSARMDRLPASVQFKLLRAAIRFAADHPDVVRVWFFGDREAARIFSRLEAERLRGRKD